MCGILVAIGEWVHQRTELLQALRQLEHRGPDHQEDLVLEGAQFYMGHTRLRILDRRDVADQPMVSGDGQLALVFNGELVNFKELRHEIGDRWNWRTDGDTEVVLAAWHVWGINCLDRFVGMFAFVLADFMRRKVYLVRDRFGIKPLYAMETERGVVISSEIPPLISSIGAAEADLPVINTYLQTATYDHTSRTFFAGIERVLPGALWEIDLDSNRVVRGRWYDVSDHLFDLTLTSRQELVEETLRLAEVAVQAHLVSDVPVGVNLSGGVDSTMLAATYGDLACGTPTLLNLDFPGYSEYGSAVQLAQGMRVERISIGLDDVMSALEGTVRSQAEPFGGVFIAGYDALYREAKRQELGVLLDGNGIDEVFLGYEKYLQGAAALGQGIDGSSASAPDAIHPRLREMPLVDVARTVVTGDDARDQGLWDLQFGKIPRSLRFTDRASMKHSIELRVPFLDHRLVEFACSIPPDRLLVDGVTKSIWREAVFARTGGSGAFAPKMSVQTPQREWLRGPLRPLVMQVLNSESFRDRQWVDPELAKREYENFLSGHRSNSFPIWQWLNLELWAREFLDA